MNPSDAGTTRVTAVAPQFTVPNVVQTAEYYRDVLGFEIAGYWDGEHVHDNPDRAAIFGIVQRDRVRVHFYRGDQSAVRTGRADGGYDVYFDVTDVDALAEEFRRRGAAILDGPEDRGYGQRELVVSDCNGLVLAFGEATSQRGHLTDTR